MGTGTGLIRVVLELEASADPIRGSIRSDSGERAFDGWMELTAALEETRAGARSDRQSENATEEESA